VWHKIWDLVAAAHGQIHDCAGCSARQVCSVKGSWKGVRAQQGMHQVPRALLAAPHEFNQSLDQATYAPYPLPIWVTWVSTSLAGTAPTHQRWKW